MKAASEYATEQFKKLGMDNNRLTGPSGVTTMQLYNLICNAYRCGFKYAEKGRDGE